MPVGIRSDGRPAGMLMYSTAFHEPQLIAMAYDLEQELNARQQPQLLGFDHSDPERRILHRPWESWATASAARQDFLRSRRFSLEDASRTTILLA